MAMYDENGNEVIVNKANCLEFLTRCTALFWPANCLLYVDFDDHDQIIYQRPFRTKISSAFPQNYQELYDFAAHGYRLMHALNLPNRNLEYPDYDALIQNSASLSFEECAQFILYYMRLYLRYGQEAFFEFWKNGDALKIIQRMIVVIDTYSGSPISEFT